MKNKIIYKFTREQISYASWLLKNGKNKNERSLAASVLASNWVYKDNCIYI